MDDEESNVLKVTDLLDVIIGNREILCRFATTNSTPSTVNISFDADTLSKLIVGLSRASGSICSRDGTSTDTSTSSKSTSPPHGVAVQSEVDTHDGEDRTPSRPSQCPKIKLRRSAKNNGYEIEDVSSGVTELQPPNLSPQTPIPSECTPVVPSSSDVSSPPVLLKEHEAVLDSSRKSLITKDDFEPRRSARSRKRSHRGSDGFTSPHNQLYVLSDRSPSSFRRQRASESSEECSLSPMKTRRILRVDCVKEVMLPGTPEKDATSDTECGQSRNIGTSDNLKPEDLQPEDLNNANLDENNTEEVADEVDEPMPILDKEETPEKEPSPELGELCPVFKEDSPIMKLVEVKDELDELYTPPVLPLEKACDNTEPIPSGPLSLSAVKSLSSCNINEKPTASKVEEKSVAKPIVIPIQISRAPSSEWAPELLDLRRSRRKPNNNCSVPPPKPSSKPKCSKITSPPKCRPDKFLVDGVQGEKPENICLENPFTTSYMPTRKDVRELNKMCKILPTTTEYLDDPVTGKKCVTVYPYAIHFPIAFTPDIVSVSMSEDFEDRLLFRSKCPRYVQWNNQTVRPRFELELGNEKHPFIFLCSGVAVRLGRAAIAAPLSISGELPDERNPFNIKLGDIVWAPWIRKGKKEYWAAYVYSFEMLDKDAYEKIANNKKMAYPISGYDKVIVAWMSDFNQYNYSVVTYKEIRPFHKTFFYRFDPKDKNDKYFKNVAQAVVAFGCCGYWESYINMKVLNHMRKMPQSAELLDSVPNIIEKIEQDSKLRPKSSKQSADARGRDKCLDAFMQMSELPRAPIDPEYARPLFMDKSYLDENEFYLDSAPDWLVNPELPMPPPTADEQDAARPWFPIPNNNNCIIQAPHEMMDGATLRRIWDSEVKTEPIPEEPQEEAEPVSYLISDQFDDVYEDPIPNENVTEEVPKTKEKEKKTKRRSTRQK